MKGEFRKTPFSLYFFYRTVKKSENNFDFVTFYRQYNKIYVKKIKKYFIECIKNIYNYA